MGWHSICNLLLFIHITVFLILVVCISRELVSLAAAVIMFRCAIMLHGGVFALSRVACVRAVVGVIRVVLLGCGTLHSQAALLYSL